jgi:Phage protein Gp138 N-terminal domain
VRPEERMRIPEVALKAALKGERSTIWTALPGIVKSFNAANMTAVIQAAIQINVLQSDGSSLPTTISRCLDCPVAFPRGGGVTLTFPITNGDEGLLIFSSRCIDAWWQNGGVQPQSELRMHDLSDGCFYPGISSVPRVPANISTSVAQLRSDDGSTLIELDAINKKVRIVAPGGVVIPGLPLVAPLVSGSLWQGGGQVRIVP